MRSILLMSLVGTISATSIGHHIGGSIAGGAVAAKAIAAKTLAAAALAADYRPRGMYDAKTVLCTADSGDSSTGFCTSNKKCTDSGGRWIGDCASGETCCKIESSCASTSDYPVTYFQSPKYPETDSMDVSCNLNIKTSKNVRQLRVDFIDFEIPGPLLDGRCQSNNNFKIYAPSSPNGILGGNDQVGLCGLNGGQHLYVPVQPGDVVQMQFTLSGTGTVPNARVASLSSHNSYLWNLKITQVESDADNEAMRNLEAPSGCLQYFQDNFGSIISFNMDGASRFSPHQNYHICINKNLEDSRKACGIEVRAQVFGLPVDHREAACEPGLLSVDVGKKDEKPPSIFHPAPEDGKKDEGRICCTRRETAFLGMVGEEDGRPETLRYRYCGQRLGSTNQVTSEPSPYFINVRSGFWNRTTELPDWAVGFNLNYKINTGSC